MCVLNHINDMKIGADAYLLCVPLTGGLTADKIVTLDKGGRSTEAADEDCCEVSDADWDAVR